MSRGGDKTWWVEAIEHTESRMMCWLWTSSQLQLIKFVNTTWMYCLTKLILTASVIISQITLHCTDGVKYWLWETTRKKKSQIQNDCEEYYSYNTHMILIQYSHWDKAVLGVSATLLPLTHLPPPHSWCFCHYWGPQSTAKPSGLERWISACRDQKQQNSPSWSHSLSITGPIVFPDSVFISFLLNTTSG